MQSMMRTLEQERARYAWQCIQHCLDHAIEGLQARIAEERNEKNREGLQRRLKTLQSEEGGKNWKREYGSLARKVPSLILTNGLGQTLAFLKAKGKGDPSDEHEVFYQHISNWLKQRLRLEDDLLEWIVNSANSQQYRIATMEALVFLQWLKRFAEAILPKGEE
ncbi:MAG: type III-B CRISPR module-associated protein Cmr5 [Candidatus Anstonellaceae archaeon]